jgi:hypothetical protein
MKEFKTWGDFAENYDLVLFNQAPNLVHKDNNSYFEGVINEWLEAHDCEYDNARVEIENLENSEKKEDIERRNELIEEYGEMPECQCEPVQWYAINIGEFDAKHLNATYGMDIFYSEILDLYILPVYHFGTAWDYVDLTKK